MQCSPPSIHLFHTQTAHHAESDDARNGVASRQALVNEGDGQHAPPQSQEKDEGWSLRLVGSLARIFANLFSFQADEGVSIVIDEP